MDLKIQLKDTILNIRDGVLLKTDKGFIFEKHPNEDFYCVIGGRIQENESSENAAKREVMEEIGIEIKNIRLKAILESFFLMDEQKCHEIGFYYKCILNGNIKLPDNFYTLSKEKIKTVKILPKIISQIIDFKNDDIVHIVTD